MLGPTKGMAWPDPVINFAELDAQNYYPARRRACFIA
jgi:hypothetical protein